MSSLVWVELAAQAPDHNISELRRSASTDVLFCATVKANAYGHGVKEIVGLLPSADWFAVNSFEEAFELRELGVKRPILLLGYVPFSQLEKAVHSDLRLTVSNQETVQTLTRLRLQEKKAKLHVKVDTGIGRQSVMPEDLDSLIDSIRQTENLHLEGISTHFANIDDTVNPEYSEEQLSLFRRLLDRLGKRGISIPIVHAANTAACVLYPETHFTMMRPGLGIYGFWPSREAFVTAKLRNPSIPALQPVLTWKTRVAQVKKLPEGNYVSYGCTFRATRNTTLAILPVGYGDGYDRGLGNTAHVLIRGKRAPVVGRVCMNLTMADVTDIPGISVEDEVVLLGRDGDENISADTMATWLGTINYEVVTRISPLLPRIVV